MFLQSVTTYAGVLMTATKVVDLFDNKEDIIKSVGDLDDIEVMHNQILVGIWRRPEKTKGGIILTDNTKKEDEYQGKVGLVLKKGPTAFISDDDMDFKGQNVEVGDWIVLRPGDGWQVKVREQPCRMLVDTSVKMKISRPDLVY